MGKATTRRIAVTRKARRKERRSSVMSSESLSWNGRTERFGVNETVFFEDCPGGRCFDESKEGECGISVGRAFQGDVRLEERCVLLLGNFPGVTTSEIRGRDERNRKNADLRVAGLNELSGLLDVFAKDKFVFNFFV
jgi:hypothetical protein